MADLIIALVFSIALVLGPVAWGVWRDGLEARAMAIHAQIQWVVNHELGGESLVSVQVTPRTPWRQGRVVLSAPTDWEMRVDSLVTPVLSHLPAGYELIVPARGRGAQPFEGTTTLTRAA